MNDETQIIRRDREQADSRPFGISMRGWLALIIVVTVCLLSGLQIEVVEPLYSMGTMALGFYFGQKVNQQK
jgi:hypothetical protein